MHKSHPPHDGRSASKFDLPVDEVTCQQFVELITECLEGTLEPRTLSLVEEHLAMCDWCDTYLEQMRATIASLREREEARAPEPPDSVLAALRARRAGGA